MGGWHHAGDLFYCPGFRAMHVLPGWKGPGTARPGADIFVWRCYDAFRGLHFSGLGGKLDVAGRFGPPLIETVVTFLASGGVLISGGFAFCLFACSDTLFALRVGLGELRFVQSRRYTFKMSVDFHNLSGQVLC